MTFQIRDFVEFDASDRAICPSCALDGKASKKNLSVLATGAYKCHRGCTPDQIRGAIGAEKPTAPPPVTVPAQPAAKVLVSPIKVREASEKLLTKSTHALRWLASRGITPEMIEHYRLGVARCKVGDSTKPSKFCHLAAVAIPIPNADGTAYFQKKRVAPWLDEGDRPDGYQAWSQYGIPAMVYTTHRPEAPTTTWLCEGEWDAIALGWAVRHSALKNDVQVSCFTCGAGNVPPDPELDRLAGDVVIFYDLDAPGGKGAEKVAARLKERAKLAIVPTAPDIDVEQKAGWDISDAIGAGLFDQVATAAAAAEPWKPTNGKNPLRLRLISNDELLERAPDYTDWLVDDILTADELFLLAASPRAGKSLMAMTLAKAVATGGRFLGRPASKGAVLYIRCEDSETKTKEREIKQGWEPGLPVYWLDKFKLSELDHLEELVSELGVRLVVLDTLSRIRDSAISESSAEMSQLLEPLQEMCKRQRCTGLLVHHTGKVNLNNAGDVDVFDTIRGSSAIRATCRGTLILAADERNYRLCVENGWGKLDLQIILDANTLEWRLLGNWMGPNVDVSQKDRVLDFMNQVAAASIDQIAEATNLPKKSLYEVLKRLQCEDLIEKRGERMQAVYVRCAATQMKLLEEAITLDDAPIQQAPSDDHQTGTTSAQIVTQGPIQQIQHVESLLNGSNPDGVKDRRVIQQKSLSATSPEKVINLEKSDQNFDHFSEEGVPPTPGELLNQTPEPIQGKGFRIQQQFNTDSTRLSAKTQEWVYCTEIETAVRLDKKGLHRSTVYVPGMGTQQFNNEFLRPIETPAVESVLNGEEEE